MELSEDQKAQLRAEEIFRAEVRAEMQKSSNQNKGKYEKLLDFFQTSLGGIFISTILVGLISFSWSYVSDVYKDYKHKEEVVERMKQEIGYRVFQLNRQYERQYKYRSLSGDSAKINWDGWKRLVFDFKDAPANSKTGFLNLYSEFSKINTIALMMQLSDLLPESRKSEVKAITLEIADNLYLPPAIRSKEEYYLLINNLIKRTSTPVWSGYFKPPSKK